MIVLGIIALVAAFFILRYRRYRLTGQALRADRQPHGDWSGRYPRSPFRR